MQISFIGHASILIESRGVRILSDPWWRGPCFGAQWWNYPQPDLARIEQRVDYIYISHGHHDHFHPGTLKTLNRDAKVLVSRNIDLADPIRHLGFEVVTIGDDEEYSLPSGIRVRIIETHDGDTLLAVADGERVCVNLNDALHAAPDDIQARFIGLLKAFYPRIDYLFCGYGVASHFPNCYRIPDKNAAATAARRQAYFNRQWARIASQLQPNFAFPFAADVVFLEHDLMWVNEPTHNLERPTEVFRQRYPESSTVAIDIAPGFQITDDAVTHPVYRQPILLPQLQEECADKIARANEYGVGKDDVFDEVLRLIRNNVDLCRPYLEEYPYDYRFLLKFRNYPKGIAILKQHGKFIVEPFSSSEGMTFDLSYMTRLQYIKWSLSSQYGHEILFVGSGGLFEYGSKTTAMKNIHRELMVVLIPHATPPESRFGKQSRWLYHLKRRVKGLLRKRAIDLYDLATWTAWK